MPRGKSNDHDKPNDKQRATWSDPDLREPRYSQSLERGLAILGCFSSKRPVLGIADIADSLGMSRSTTHRYVITLVALGYLEQGASRKYRLGLRVTDLGMSALDSSGLREHARAELEGLRQRTTYTAGLGVLNGKEIVYVDRARGLRHEPDKLDPQPGSRLPAYCTAIGKLLLAYLPEHEQRELISNMTLTKRGPNTITAKKALRDELDRIRQEGLAVNDQELSPELRTLAAPVRDDTGAVRAAVNLSVPSASTTLAELVDSLGPQLVETAERISTSLGYRGDDE
ncbi:MAG TPA: IclR family transcriptional regulator [Solirubrobacteraceae bacterium]|jgi:IclR family pca regulon transcriptional regulator